MDARQIGNVGETEISPTSAQKMRERVAFGSLPLRDWRGDDSAVLFYAIPSPFGAYELLELFSDECGEVGEMRHVEESSTSRCISPGVVGIRQILRRGVGSDQNQMNYRGYSKKGIRPAAPMADHVILRPSTFIGDLVASNNRAIIGGVENALNDMIYRKTGAISHYGRIEDSQCSDLATHL